MTPVRGACVALALAVLLGATPARHARAGELSVYAAASLRDVLGKIAPRFEKESGETVVFNFGSSGDLARQIVAAAKADVFLSAGVKEMDQVAAEHLVAEGTRRDLLSNQLVVIESRDAAHPDRSRFKAPFVATQLADPSVTRLSLADPATVPAGRYAKEWLEKVGVWTQVAGRVLPAVDVRAALAAVASGGAPAGIVYRTDAAHADGVRVAHVVPLAEGARIVYPVAAIRDRPALAQAKRFLAFLSTRESRATFEGDGFAVMGAAE